jgi:hypothetical protein
LARTGVLKHIVGASVAVRGYQSKARKFPTEGSAPYSPT